MSNIEQTLRRTMPHYNDPVTLKPKLVNPDGPEAADTIARLRAALEAIDDLCEGEIKARFGTSSHKTVEEVAGNSHIYSLLILPRNIARAALEGEG